MLELRKKIVVAHSTALSLIDEWSLKDNFEHISVNEAMERLEDAIDRLNEITEGDWL